MINFCCEDIEFVFKKKRNTMRWFGDIAVSENRKIGNVSIVFCSDSYILNLNRKYLNHDFFTDIITFDYCEGVVLSGDIFISIDTVRTNSVEYGTSFEDELHRVMVHGLLHLIGYDDHTEDEVRTMRAKEDFYLASFNVNA